MAQNTQEKSQKQSVQNGPTAEEIAAQVKADLEAAEKLADEQAAALAAEQAAIIAAIEEENKELVRVAQEAAKRQRENLLKIREAQALPQIRAFDEKFAPLRDAFETADGVYQGLYAAWLMLPEVVEATEILSKARAAMEAEAANDPRLTLAQAAVSAPKSNGSRLASPETKVTTVFGLTGLSQDDKNILMSKPEFRVVDGVVQTTIETSGENAYTHATNRLLHRLRGTGGLDRQDVNGYNTEKGGCVIISQVPPQS
jgi:hypothetical protein